jgi:hypothetical protein
MLWEIRARMKPALAIIDLVPHVHRTPALALLRRAVQEGRPATLPLSREERDLAFYDAPVALVSPIGARVLKALYTAGLIKLKKPGLRALPALDAYIATEAAFRAGVAAILDADEAQRRRLDEIVADPAVALVSEVTPALIDKVMTARMGHGFFGRMEIAGLECHRSLVAHGGAEDARFRSESRVACWWYDADGVRHGDAV